MLKKLHFMLLLYKYKKICNACAMSYSRASFIFLNACSSSNGSLRYCSSSIALHGNHCRTVSVRNSEWLFQILCNSFLRLDSLQTTVSSSSSVFAFSIGQLVLQFSPARQVRRTRLSQPAQQWYYLRLNVRVLFFFLYLRSSRLHHCEFRDLCCCCLHIPKPPPTPWQLTWQVC